MRSPAPPPPTTAALPGTRLSCALLTVLTILLAWPNQAPWVGVVVRAGYFALLTGFFWRTTRDSPALEGQPMRLVRGGFLVLSLAFVTSAAIHLAGLEDRHPGFTYLRAVCERGALFLLGTTLISYGLMLWLPQVLASHRLLGEHYARQRGELQLAESTRSQLEQRLVEADRRGMLGELAASIAHDLRNPLTIVVGTAESLCRKPRSNAEVAEHTAVIRRNIEKADRTIQTLIDLARPRTQIQGDVPALEVLTEISGLLQVEAQRRRVPLHVFPDHGDPPHLRTDRTLLAQALLNLALNALQASTDSDGGVDLRARRFRLGGRERIAVVVADRGSGLPPEVHSRLFTPFFTTKANGTGLGLSSCRRIASELHGALRLYPRHRGGARAILLLPADPDSPLVRENADEAPAWAATSC